MFRRKRRHLRVFVSPRRDASDGGRAGIIAVVSRCGIRGNASLVSEILREQRGFIDADGHEGSDEDEDAISAGASIIPSGSSATHPMLLSPEDEANDEHSTVWVKSNHWQCLQQYFCLQR